MQRIFSALAAIGIILYLLFQLFLQQSTSEPTGTLGNERIIQAVNNRQSGFMVEASAKVERLLRDDNEGSRHQRFIVRLDSGHSLLIAHNIDLARRVPVRRGDRIRFFGQYEWNQQGGVIHWTHHDPNKRHAEGWIEHQGKKYQ